MPDIITMKYDSIPVFFQTDAYLNATQIAKHFNKKPKDWLKTQQTKDYIQALAKKLTIPASQLVIIKEGSPELGGGSYLHPKLAVDFARWLSPDFAVWCDEKIEELLHPTFHDPKTAAIFQVLIKVDQVERQQEQQAQQLRETKVELETKIDQVDIKTRNGVPLGYIGRKEAWRQYGRGVSEEIFRMAMDVLNVPTEKYIHTTSDGFEVVSFAYKKCDIPDAVDFLIDDAVQVSPKYCKSPMLSDRRFMLVKSEAEAA